jgi:hypothetical protein
MQSQKLKTKITSPSDLVQCQNTISWGLFKSQFDYYMKFHGNQYTLSNIWVYNQQFIQWIYMERLLHDRRYK